MSEPNLGPSPAQITLMGHNIVAKIAARRARRRRRVRFAVAGGVVAVGLGITAATIGITAAPPGIQATGYSCYVADDLGADFHVMPYPDDLTPPPGPERIAAALELCDIAYGMHGVQVSDPTVCELRDLRLGVFPNTERLEPRALCTSLGLGLPPD
jgi:hypothetical protein